MNNLKIFNYSFAAIDVVNFFPHFFEARRKSKEVLLGVDQDKSQSFNAKDLISIVTEQLSGVNTENVDWNRGFRTLDFLYFVLDKYLNGGQPGEELDDIIDKLQKKFELFRRIFDGYTANVKKAEYAGENVEVYALFSIILNLRFLNCGNFNNCNTAIKLIDLILLGDLKIEQKTKKILSNAILLEKHILNSTYE